MGLRHSSLVCDAAFLVGTERTNVLSGAALEEASIKAYYRFRDDIWILAGDRAKFRDWFGRFKRSVGHIFKLKAVQHSSSCVTMLAVDVVRSGNKLLTRPRGNRVPGAPLSQHSCHPPHVLSSWPLSYKKNLANITSKDFLERAETALIDKFRRYHIHIS